MSSYNNGSMEVEPLEPLALNGKLEIKAGNLILGADFVSIRTRTREGLELPLASGVILIPYKEGHRQAMPYGYLN